MRAQLLLITSLAACTGTIKTDTSGGDSQDSGVTDDSGAHEDSATDDSGDGGDSGGGGGDSAETGGTDDCVPRDDVLIVTDIDETLTTDDLEFIQQIVDPDHDPEMRPDANTLMQGYHDLGYRIVYLTARGDDLYLLDGTSATDATTAWLDLHGFPYEPEDVYLADGIGAFSEDAADYKTEVLEGLMADGLSVAFAYGNADTDIEAYQAVAIPDDHIFLVGDLAGEYGVEPIPTEDAYTNHLASFLPTVPCAGE